jgi:hypothetical protein
MKASARLIFDRALPRARASSASRTKAYTCLALAERLSIEPNDQNLRENLRLLANELLSLYEAVHAAEWEWFENVLAYENARLCHALFAAYSALGERRYLDVATRTLQFLTRVETLNGMYSPVGNSGWYKRGGIRAQYDQQPVDAGAMVEAAAFAFRLARDSLYERAVKAALGWFFGINSKSVKVYDESTGACYDGINPEGVNQNQGSESTIAFLLAATAVVEKFGD